MARGNASAETIDAIRRFNRFYTRQFGLFGEGLLDSPFSLTQARILYELAHHEGMTATELAATLRIDAGYLSRTLKGLEESGRIDRTRASGDARRMELRLTRAGRSAFAPLERAAREQVAQMIAGLDPGQAAELLAAMGIVERLLQPQDAPKVPYLLRGLQTGDLGWITHRQGLLYAQEHGWDGTYEALVAEILAGFVKTFDPSTEAAWIAEREAVVVGSVFLVRESARVARLRLLYVEPSARGLGIGRRLVDECIRFARAKSYRTLTLWTNDVLASARRIYQAAGFEKTREERHHSFGKDLLGQTWTLDLSGKTRMANQVNAHSDPR